MAITSFAALLGAPTQEDVSKLESLFLNESVFSNHGSSRAGHGGAVQVVRMDVVPRAGSEDTKRTGAGLRLLVESFAFAECGGSINRLRATDPLPPSPSPAPRRQILIVHFKALETWDLAREHAAPVAVEAARNKALQFAFAKPTTAKIYLWRPAPGTMEKIMKMQQEAMALTT
ncbi:hypothetical protein H9P43_005170 [Blastocladiella emersonii ATCC 22665]|nr:hypothetical protein H9P43_005170 [Blastocladiella emersonii ATCC 22665]